jgi:hypothetical protein
MLLLLYNLYSCIACFMDDMFSMVVPQNVDFEYIESKIIDG